MAPRIAVAVALLVVAVAACSHLLRADGGGGDGVVALVGSCDDGSAAAALGQCWMGDGLVRKPSGKYISYAALRADQIPCTMRGQSYYENCGYGGSMKQMNPYTRGCSAITRCARNMN